jgi:membrane-associated phospholipid phosphatase
MDGGVRPVVRRVTARTVSAWRTPRERRLGIALVVAAFAAISFARVTEDYLTNDPLARWDVSFARWLAGERDGAGTDLARVVTFVGSPAFVLAVCTVVCLVLYRRGRIADAIFLPLVLGGAELLNLILKLSFHRQRPEFAFVHLDTYSYPSGHAMISVAGYGALVYLVWGRLGSWRARALVTGGAAVLVGLICFSRLYLGVHYLSDVLAGIAGGFFWLAAAVAIHTLYGDRVAAWLTGSRLDRLLRHGT